jgi:hypothetical protein
MPRAGRAAPAASTRAPAGPFAGPFRARARWAGLAEVAAGLALLIGWALLWSVLLAGVAPTAGRLASRSAVASRREAVLRLDPAAARAP